MKSMLGPVRVLTVIALLAGCAALAFGAFAMFSDPSDAPTCEGKVMQHGDACFSRSGSFTYESKLAERREDHENAGSTLALGGVLVVAGGGGQLLLRRRDRLIRRAGAGAIRRVRPDDSRPSAARALAEAGAELRIRMRPTVGMVMLLVLPTAAVVLVVQGLRSGDGGLLVVAGYGAPFAIASAVFAVRALRHRVGGTTILVADRQGMRAQGWQHHIGWATIREVAVGLGETDRGRLTLYVTHESRTDPYLIPLPAGLNHGWTDLFDYLAVTAPHIVLLDRRDHDSARPGTA
ncbi:hypothetical protein JK358_22200 [Nocardia sp. 2]|uniref:Uncharacterized protein n=1 Tax=Nocardia acididurans TaxID=2802282 RepID=A0ABS1M970_9NOCA|nr:hypothetical protein [Nocardia acididurans]MBL1077114.1 hypothetical protein [Nocardia acididurans]